jgi:DNA-binding NarL/FixJ family response regulator
MVATADGDDFAFTGEPSALAPAGGPSSPPSRQAGSQREFRAFGVVVGSDDPFTRRAFRSGAIGPSIQVLAEGTVMAVTEQLAAELKPDIVLLDVQIAAASGLRAIQRIRARLPETRILACSAPAGTEFGLLCLRAGAWGYVSKEIDLAVLPNILWALGHGEAVIPGALATELVRRFARTAPPERPDAGELSAPECRLLELLRIGLTLPEAAAELRVTLATARRHLGSARRKLAVPPAASARRARWSPHQLER